MLTPLRSRPQLSITNSGSWAYAYVRTYAFFLAGRARKPSLHARVESAAALDGAPYVGRRGSICCGPFLPWAGIWKRCQMFTANCSECRWATTPGSLEAFQGARKQPEGCSPHQTPEFCCRAACPPLVHSPLHRPVNFVRRTRRHRIPIDHEQHGEPGVLAHETNDLDDAAFADQRLGGLEVSVAHLAGRQKLCTEIVHRRLVRRHVCRPLAGRHGGDEGWAEAGVERLLAMRIPNILAAPVARRKHNGDFLELARHRRLEAQIVAERPRQLGHFGAAQIDVEGTGFRLAPAGDFLVGKGALLGRQLCIGERLETVAAGIEFRSSSSHDD